MPSAPAPSDPEDEARFVARLAVDLIAVQATATGDLRINASMIVTDAIGLLRETRRQLAEGRAKETGR